MTTPEPSPRRARLRRLAGTAVTLLLVLLLVRLAGSAPREGLARLARIDVPLAAAALAVYALGFGARALRLNLLLPEHERLPVTTGWALSGASTFLLQVVPFRGGEIASWALYRRVLGVGWARAGAVFVLVKTVDSATMLVVGLAGGAVLALRRGSPVLGNAAAAAVVAGVVALALLPRLGGSAARALALRSPEGSRRRRALSEMADGLQVAHDAPRAYLLAFAGALGFLAAHLAALALLMRALGVPSTVAGLAFASLTSVLSAAVVPSPAGTFGTMESGFAAGLALDGIAPGLGAAAAAIAHVLTTGVCGLLGLPLLVGRKG